jgi:beta-glucosidase
MTSPADSPAPVGSGAPYYDPALTVEERVADLLGRMSRAEKIAQLRSVWGFELLGRGVSEAMEDMEFSDERCRERLRDGIGHISRSVGSTNRGPVGSAEFVNGVQRFLVEETRLGIPAIVHDECLCGLAGRGATQFPMMIGMASTFDPELVHLMADAIRVEMRAVGSLQGLAPVLDITRDPRWGRCEETFGEDAYLAARMGVAYVRGLQGELEHGVAATGKHFLGYGFSEGGLNHASAHIPTRELLEHVAMPFAAAIREAGLASIMNSYSDLDGIPTLSVPILRELLRGRLGFTGHTVADYTSVDRLVDWQAVAATRADAARTALEAGLDVELPTVSCYGEPLASEVDDGRVPQSLLDEAVARVVRTKFLLGLFERPYVDPRAAEQAVGTRRHREVARMLAQKSLVLLANDGVLPLRSDLRSIAVIGPNADSLRRQRGVFHYPSQVEVIQAIERIVAEAGGDLPGPAVSGGDLSLEGATVLEAIRDQVSSDTTVRYAIGCDVDGDSTSGFAEAVAAAEASDVAVVVVGESSGMVPGYTNGEFHDRAELHLPGAQEALIAALAQTGTPLVLVLVTGRPPVLTAAATHAAAILLAWLPGEEGGPAIADALFGQVNPGGKLPISLPRSVGQVPVYYNHKTGGGRSFPYGDYWDLPAGPLYPFGHGLSYTSFELANLAVTPATTTPAGEVIVSVEVENVGTRAGDAVVQLYARDVVASLARPVRELRGFQRLELQPSERRVVRFRLRAAELGFFNRDLEFVVEPGAFELAVAFSAEDIRLTHSLLVEGKRPELVERVFFSDSEVEACS